MKTWVNGSWWKLKWCPENNELGGGIHNHRFDVILPWYMALMRISMWVLGILSIPLLITGCIMMELGIWWGAVFLFLPLASWIYVLVAEDKYFAWLEKAAEEDKATYYETVIKPHNEEQQRLADEWRENHPLEEKCRLAMSKNPNYVADLIRYIKEKGNNELC